MAAPPLGAKGTNWSTRAPAMYTGIGGPGTLVAATSVPFIIPAAKAVVAGRGRDVRTRKIGSLISRAGSVRAWSRIG